jgi:hypothetical protein
MRRRYAGPASLRCSLPRCRTPWRRTRRCVRRAVHGHGRAAEHAAAPRARPRPACSPPLFHLLVHRRLAVAAAAIAHNGKERGRRRVARPCRGGGGMRRVRCWRCQPRAGAGGWHGLVAEAEGCAGSGAGDASRGRAPAGARWWRSCCRPGIPNPYAATRKPGADWGRAPRSASRQSEYGRRCGQSPSVRREEEGKGPAADVRSTG